MPNPIIPFEDVIEASTVSFKPPVGDFNLSILRKVLVSTAELVSRNLANYRLVYDICEYAIEMIHIFTDTMLSTSGSEVTSSDSEMAITVSVRETTVFPMN